MATATGKVEGRLDDPLMQEGITITKPNNVRDIIKPNGYKAVGIPLPAKTAPDWSSRPFFLGSR